MVCKDPFMFHMNPTGAYLDQNVVYKDPGIARNSIIGQKDHIMIEMDLLLLHKKYKMTGSDAPGFVTKMQIWVDCRIRYIEIAPELDILK